ncbi:DUF4177 domain-containing protein [Singulisphaera rosea]
MRSNRSVAVAAFFGFAVGLFVLSNTTTGQAPEAKPPIVWEYKEVIGQHYIDDNTKLLNRQGQEGWELVSTILATQSRLRYTMKRPKPN